MSEIKLDKSLIEITNPIRRIMEELNSIRCKALIVGGAVRDALLEITPKDIDIEVYNVSYGDMEAFLSRHGKVDLVGKSFGVIKFKPDGEDETYDFSIPRKESRIGVGHKAFEVSFDQSMTIQDAAMRRDFCFNALAYDPLENKIYDYFGGMEDLKNKVIRHTSTAFGEDPLRVLRAMNFQARFDFTIHPDTIQIMKEIVASGEMESLPKERVFEEWMKWSVKGIRHDLIFKFLRYTNLIDCYPELKTLKNTSQDKIYHPEGNVEIHTRMCLAEMDKIIEREKITGQEKAILVMSILLHDIGKPATTKSEIKRIEIAPTLPDDALKMGRLILAECQSKMYMGKKEGQILVNDKWVDPIIISDTDRINVGDVYAMNLDGWVIMYPCQDAAEAERCNSHYSISGNCKKILALPENISSKHLDQISEGKLKDGDSIFIGRMTITSNGHEALGGTMSREFLYRLGFHEELIAPICNLVSDHLASVSIASIPSRSGKLKAIKRLSRRLYPATIQQLLYVIEADHNGRGSDVHKDATSSKELLELSKELNVDKKPYEYILMGRHLIDEGLNPSPEFGIILKQAEVAQEDGLFSEINGAREWLKRYLSEKIEGAYCIDDTDKKIKS